MTRAGRRRLRTFFLGIVAAVALFWGAIDIVGASPDRLWASLGAVLVGSVALVGLAALAAVLLILVKHRSRR
ncbi:hypothetical protein [Luminiphilus syltensis]|uniref:hypothetical protein n=1 Tax=Luminiphilus syltensis TaxID=1341119 RepID=UPI0002D8D48A|nr:hypothetical protein [Luminiphilus syltensis]